jgi:hypothetical protein
MKSTYKTPPYTRAQLESWKILCVTEAERERADKAQAAFDAEDREEIAARGFVQKVRDLCRTTIDGMKGTR